MRFAFTDEQEELRRGVRRALDGGADPVAQLGLDGLLEAGLGWVEIVAVQEELGRALAPGPFFSTVCLGANALDACGALYLRDDRTATLALGEVEARGGSLHGVARQVVDGDTAALLVVAARDGLYVTEGGARARLPTLDQTRALADVTFDATPATRIGDLSDRVLARARIALAAEQVGGAQRCLDLAVEYAKVRHQFGRPIGSFQAVQHTLAEMFMLVEAARSAAYHAGWAADHDDPDLPTTAAIAAAFCGDAFFRVAGDTIQVHGGIGFTWEHPAHRYFKRARASRALLGAPDHHREHVARRILDDGSPLL